MRALPCVGARSGSAVAASARWRQPRAEVFRGRECIASGWYEAADDYRRNWVARTRADDALCGAGRCGLGNAWRPFLGRDGARNQCKHDDAKAGHLKLIVLAFQFLLRHTDNCPARDLNNERVCLCSRAHRIRDAEAIADSIGFTRFVMARR